MMILLADDEEGIRRLYAEMLQGNGHDVTVAEDGEEALKLLDGEEFDLMILDLYMPNKDGFQVLAEIQKSGREVPTIIMTGHFPMDEVNERTRGMGVKEILGKPVTITSLLNAVNRVVSGS